jgi:hypothetical protein
MLALVVISAYVGPGHGPPWRSVSAAAAGDTLVAVSGNQIARTWVQRPLLAIAWTAAVAASGTGSVTAESAALQQLPASRVGPIVSSVGAVLPVVLWRCSRRNASPSASARRRFWRSDFC